MNRTPEYRQAARVAAINSADETLACVDCSKLSVIERKILRDCAAALFRKFYYDRPLNLLGKDYLIHEFADAFLEHADEIHFRLDLVNELRRRFERYEP